MTKRIYGSYLDYQDEFDDFEYVPDNADEGEVYLWEDFVRETLGNVTYARDLASQGDLWAFPSTMIDEDVREGVVEFNPELGTLDYSAEGLGYEVEECVYDEDFFDPDCMLYR